MIETNNTDSFLYFLEKIPSGNVRKFLMIIMDEIRKLDETFSNEMKMKMLEIISDMENRQGPGLMNLIEILKDIQIDNNFCNGMISEFNIHSEHLKTLPRLFNDMKQFHNPNRIKGNYERFCNALLRICEKAQH